MSIGVKEKPSAWEGYQLCISDYLKFLFFEYLLDETLGGKLTFASTFFSFILVVFKEPHDKKRPSTIIRDLVKILIIFMIVFEVLSKYPLANCSALSLNQGFHGQGLFVQLFWFCYSIS